MNYYFDTNVLLSQYKSTDPFHRASLVIVRGLKGGDLVGFTSPLAVIEACCFIGRNFPPRKGQSREEARTIAVAKFIRGLSTLRLVFTYPTGDYQLPLDGGRVLMPAIFHQALILSFLGLRTLDVLHLASARYAGRTRADIQGFVTGDADFIERKRIVSKVIGMPVLSPKELIDAVGMRDT